MNSTYLTGYASAQRRDLQGDIVEQDWTNVTHLPLLWMHNPKLKIGHITKAWKTPLGLVIQAQLNTHSPFFNQIQRMYHQNSGGLSIGISVTSSRTNGYTRYISGNLTEVSVVYTPANQACQSFELTTNTLFSFGKANLPLPKIALKNYNLDQSFHNFIKTTS